MAQFGMAPAWERQEAAVFLAKVVPRLQILDLATANPATSLLDAVRRGLQATPRTLPPAYFYDRQGSELYERITALPAYYPTRAEAGLLRQVVPQIMGQLAPQQIVELGSGSSAKTRTFFETIEARRGLTYVPIDIGAAMLSETAAQLIKRYPWLRVLGLVGRYEDALAVLPMNHERLVVFLGSTIGNFTPEEQAVFFQNLALTMLPGSHLLLGFDRQPHAGKPVRIIQDAYNDGQGVTAAFNLNLLHRLNRECGADFRLDHWTHQAIYNDDRHQIEMYLESRAAQTVTIPGLDLRLAVAPGERILTEISRKFDPPALAAWFAPLGYQCVGQWSDEGGLVGLLLLRRL